MRRSTFWMVLAALTTDAASMLARGWRLRTALLADHLPAAACMPWRHVVMQEDSRRGVSRRRKQQDGASDDIMRAAAARWAENDANDQVIKCQEENAMTDKNFAALEALMKAPPSPRSAKPLRGGRRLSQERDEARQNVSDAVTRWEDSIEVRNSRQLTKETDDAEAAERRAEEQRAALHAAMQTWTDQSEVEALNAMNAMMALGTRVGSEEDV